MYKLKSLGWTSFIFLVFFLLVSLPQAQSAEGTGGNAPIMVAAQEATIPLATNAVTGGSERQSLPTSCGSKQGLCFSTGRIMTAGHCMRILVVERAINADDLDLGFDTGRISA